MEPFLPDDLLTEEPTSPNWSSQALRALAKQLGVGNDFYFPLLDAARILEERK